ncbi:MAG: hypothetical protein FWH24_02950 [Oscillospiraceae bacterium]|nr:hypothetical protein [Oscillospiraceae bacterium]
MKILRIFSIGVLIAMLILSVLFTASCQSNEAPVQNDLNDSNASNEAAPEQNDVTGEDPDYIELLSSEYDFNGYEFKVMVPEGEAHMSDSGPAIYASEELIGEVVNDAIFNRNKKIESALNIVINVFVHAPGSIIETYHAVARDVKAGDRSFDIAIPHIIQNVDAMAAEGLLADWNHIASVDFTQPWWNKAAMDSFSMAKRNFFAVSEFNFGNYGNTYAMFFNKDFLQEYNLENPYDLVREKKWTVDKILEMTKDIYQDLNGNGTVDPEDLFGYSGSNTGVLLGFMYASEIVLFKTDDEGVPYIAFINEKTNNLINKITGLYYEDNRSYIYGNTEINIFKAMEENRMFLQADKISEIIKLRGAEIDFGILPYPLYDENQERYRTYVDAWGGVLCIPSNIYDDELDKIGVIVDALSYETMVNLKPAYYEIALKGKYARDEESGEMLDILYGGLIYDLSYAFNRGAHHNHLIFPSNVNERRGSRFVSSMERIEPAIQSYLDDMHERISNLD